MKKYIGIKEVQAEPMDELSAIELRYARANDDLQEWRDGYHVLYPDNNNFWLPADVFNSTYKCADSFIDRIHIELEELQKRIKKIEQRENRDVLLDIQYNIMKSYEDVLMLRISSFIHHQQD
ncbi:MAG: hypothetical protein J6V00_06225 [Bacteroidaceae bacterium]|nr:hypothetical protein [Bacteroidaceae bacterium]